MSDEEGNVSVSALRAQIQEKLAKNGISNGHVFVKAQAITENGPSSPSPVRSPPPIPSHKSTSPENARPPPRPPPPPPHRNERRHSAAKPPIAPKPELRKTSSSTPSIIVDCTADDETSFSREGSVRARAKDLETHLGLKLRNGSPSSSSDTVSFTERPISMVSTASAQSEMTDSDSDDGRPPELLRSIGIDMLTPPGKMNLRRPSALCFNGDTSMHEKIMEELKRQGVVRSSSHQGIYKKNASPRAPRRPPPSSQTQPENNNETKMADEGIPEEIGRLREEKKLRVPEFTLSMASTSTTQSEDSFFDNREHNDSSATDRSSFYTTSTAGDTEQEVRDYDTGDAAEDKRLKKLHYAANEFHSVQEKFVEYLIKMEKVYPNYVAEYGRRLSKDLLAPPPGQPVHPVRQIQDLFSQMLPVHQILLEQFTTQYAIWDSQKPGMSAVFHRFADFLKICIPFLKLKGKIVEEMSKLRDENRDFDNATVAFEQKIFNRGVGAVVQQLDQVHQNFMRYKILMISYRNYLLPDSEEYAQASSAIQKLEAIAQKVNEEMGLPSNEELFKLYDRFQTHFDVFAPGRRLIRQGETLKQTRKDYQHRYLVLFSDVLWICRVASLSSGLFDLNRSYQLAIEALTTHTMEHEDFETHLIIKSKEKSFGLVFKNAKEMKQWEKDIRTAREDKRKYRRRMSEAQERQRRQNSITPVLFKQPTLPEEGNEDTTSSKDMTIIVAASRSQSVDTPSQPSTPVDDVPAGSSGLQFTPKGKIRRVDKDKPLWIPDEASSKCLMEGCGSVFSLINRRHHCRDCGYLICSKCSGRAPLSKYDFKKELVCPECYGRILERYTKGDLFPTRLLTAVSNGEWRVRVKKGKRGTALVEPRTLFYPPTNMGLKRISVDSRVTLHEDAVFNEVFVKTRDGTEMSRFALLTEGAVLKFFKFRLDNEPVEQHVLCGFDLKETVLDEGGTEFELVHRNQIQTDRKEHVIVFRVQHEKSVQKWSSALRKALGLPKEDAS